MKHFREISRAPRMALESGEATTAEVLALITGLLDALATFFTSKETN